MCMFGISEIWLLVKCILFCVYRFSLVVLLIGKLCIGKVLGRIVVLIVLLVRI